MASVEPGTLSVSLSLDRCSASECYGQKTDTLRKFVDILPLAKSAQGLLNAGYDAAGDLRCPQVRRSPTTTDAVQHLESVSSWRDLPQSSAVELKVWYGIFEQAITNEINRRIREDLFHHLCEFDDLSDTTVLIRRVYLYINDRSPRVMGVDMEPLVHDMMTLFYAHHPSESAARNFTWTIGTTDLPSVVYNFVRVQDCFFHTLDGPCVTFTLQPAQPQSETLVDINIEWVPPRVTFSTCDIFDGREGRYRITPHSSKTDSGTRWGCNFEPYEEFIKYEVTKSSLPLQWNEHGGHFEAPLSCELLARKRQIISGSNHHLHILPQDTTRLETVVSAMNTIMFPGGVRFYSISRYRIVSDIHNEQSVLATTLSNALPVRTEISKRKISSELVPEYFHSYGLDAIKSSKLVTNEKRRKMSLSQHDAANEMEDQEWWDMRAVDITTGALGDAQSSPTSTLRGQTCRSQLPRLDTSLKQYRARRCGTKNTTFPWDPWNKGNCPSPETPPTASSEQSLVFDAPPALEVPEIDLSQDEIQRNYHEFEERRKDRAAERAFYAATIPGFDGILSPTEETDRVMESIFLDVDHDADANIEDVGQDTEFDTDQDSSCERDDES